MNAARPVFTWHDYQGHAEHNEVFLNFFINQVLKKEPGFADWAITVCFYAALHYTKAAILRDHGVAVIRHRSGLGKGGVWEEGHNVLVRKHLRAISPEYRDMFDLSI